MEKLTRKDLKTDKFAVEVQHGMEYVSDHRTQAVRWSAIGAGLLLLALAVSLYMQHQHTVRQNALREAIRIQDANIGPGQSEYVVSYPTKEQKNKAAVKAFSDIAARYGGSDEGVIANYYLATNAADAGNISEAEKRFQEVANSGSSDYASLARLSLADILSSEGKLPEAQKLIQADIDKPTVMVSKEAATIAMARMLAPTNPQQSRKLLEPLRASERSPVSRTALTALGELSSK